VVADDAGGDTDLGPKRRRRSGRGAGAATVPASEELAELLSPDADVEPAQSEAAFVESVIVEAEPESQEPAAPRRRRRATSRPAGAPLG
ncbi:MAG: hypothetical protein M3486_03100, partial [Actinomycetota bacterium]|nr:hypothetical protein [Actinomycetota bacterium]